MKRTNQVKMMIEATNEVMKSNRIIDEKNDVFHVTCWLLMKANTYKGFGWFYDKQVGDSIVSINAGTDNKEVLKGLNAYLQIL